MQRRALMVLLLATAAVFSASAPAAAHNTVTTDDGAFFLTIGHLNEPTTTYMKTGFDLTVRVNQSGQRGAEVDGVHQTLSAVYIAPGGQELEAVLTKQFGTTGKYTFEDPLFLTEAGQYTVRLSGTINGTTVDGTYNVSGPVPDFRDHTFPDELQTQKQLQDRIAALESRIAELESGSMQDTGATDDGARAFSPGLDAFFLVAVVGLAGLLLRRRN